MNTKEVCQYKISERIYFANYDEITLKIRNGNILRHDLVKIGNGAWTEAQNIPTFNETFIETENRLKIPDTLDFKNIYTNFQVKEIWFEQNVEEITVIEKVCSIHSERKPDFVCTICKNLFCKECLIENESKQTVCLYCGGNCDNYNKRLWKFEAEKNLINYEIEEQTQGLQPQKYEVVYTKLKFKDFVNASIQPFIFPFSLIVAGTLFSVLVFGLLVTIFQSDWLLLLGFGIVSLIVMMQFGILSKSIENCSQFNRKWKCNIPHLKKFAVWEDFVTPFWSGLKASLLSFSLFIVLGTIAAVFAWFSFSGDIQEMQTEMVKTNNQVNDVLLKDSSESSKLKKLDEDFSKMMDNARFRQMESVFGKNHLVNNKELERFIKSMMRLTIWLQMPICFAFILGLLFFPAVCLSVGERRDLTMKKRFFSSLKMMETIGFDYVKILFMCIVLTIFSLILTYILSLFVKKLEMPMADIVSTIVLSSFLVFYFWLVFSNIIGIIILRKENVLVEGS